MDRGVVVLPLRRSKDAKVATERVGVMQGEQGLERFVLYNSITVQ